MGIAIAAAAAYFQTFVLLGVLTRVGIFSKGSGFAGTKRITYKP